MQLYTKIFLAVIFLFYEIRPMHYTKIFLAVNFFFFFKIRSMQYTKIFGLKKNIKISVEKNDIINV